MCIGYWQISKKNRMRGHWPACMAGKRACLCTILVIALLSFIGGCSRGDEQSTAVATSDVVKENDRWRQLGFPAADWKHDDIFFINKEVGWVVVNTAGEIHKTVDGGGTWKLQFKPPEQPFFRCIAFSDQQHGFACNLSAGKHKNPLYRTIDGGSSWSAVDLSDEVEGLCGISVVNSNLIYLTGRYPGPAYLVKSEDGGNSWSVKDMSDYLGRSVDIHFFDENEGLLLGGSTDSALKSRVVVLGTSDGGITWKVRYRGPRNGEWGWKFSFPSRDIGYASVDTEPLTNVDTAYFLKTEDGGRSWRRIPFYRGQYRAQGIGFANDNTGWMGSFLRDRPTLRTEDGGVSWIETNFGNRINRFRFIDDTGFAAGHRLYRMRRLSDTNIRTGP